MMYLELKTSNYIYRRRTVADIEEEDALKRKISLDREKKREEEAISFLSVCFFILTTSSIYIYKHTSTGTIVSILKKENETCPTALQNKIQHNFAVD